MNASQGCSDVHLRVDVAAARFCLQDDGTVYVAKVGNLNVKWSCRLPAAPTSVTVTMDSSAGTSSALSLTPSGVSSPGRRPKPVSTSACPPSPSCPTAGRSIARASCAGLRRSSSAFSGSCPARPRDRRTGPRPASRSHASTPRWQTDVGTGTTRHPHRSSATTKRVYVEDLAVSGLGRTRLAKSVHDAGWSASVGMLEYKAALHGCAFATVDRALPSSQVCSACGFRDGPKPLHVREWTCGACGTVHDRDHNAARVAAPSGR